MSFQAYLDNIKIKTGKTPADFKVLADKKGLLKEGVKAGEMVSWLKKDFELGHGHAMAIYTALKGLKEQKADKAAMLNKHFSGNRSSWKPAFNFLYAEVKNFGNDITLDPAASYISILRSGKKFAIVQVTAQRMDIGIKLKTVLPTKRFESAGNWNVMMTHRVRLADKKEIDQELLTWMKNAYRNAVLIQGKKRA